MYPTEHTELLKHISVQWYNKKGESPKTQNQMEDFTMGDMKEDFAALKAWKKERHAQWKVDNTACLLESMKGRFAIRNNGETLIFREKHYPRVDFYPSTGRWRIPGKKKTYRGGAKSFINWYEKQKEK